MEWTRQMSGKSFHLNFSSFEFSSDCDCCFEPYIRHSNMAALVLQLQGLLPTLAEPLFVLPLVTGSSICWPPLSRAHALQTSQLIGGTAQPY